MVEVANWLRENFFWTGYWFGVLCLGPFILIAVLRMLYVSCYRENVLKGSQTDLDDEDWGLVLLIGGLVGIALAFLWPATPVALFGKWVIGRPVKPKTPPKKLEGKKDWVEGYE